MFADNLTYEEATKRFDAYGKKSNLEMKLFELQLNRTKITDSERRAANRRTLRAAQKAGTDHLLNFSHADVYFSSDTDD